MLIIYLHCSLFPFLLVVVSFANIACTPSLWYCAAFGASCASTSTSRRKGRRVASCGLKTMVTCCAHAQLCCVIAIAFDLRSSSTRRGASQRRVREKERFGEISPENGDSAESRLSPVKTCKLIFVKFQVDYYRQHSMTTVIIVSHPNIHVCMPTQR